MDTAPSAYDKLIALLDQHQAEYRLIDHAPEGRTDVVSPLRGNALHEAAKCIVLMLKITKKQKKFILAVVAGDARVDFSAIKALFNARYAAFADSDIAEAMAGSAAGTILPFSFHPDLELIVDPALLENVEIFFNAARLDRSIALSTADYVAIAAPRVEAIGEGGGKEVDR
jgi:Ala-tRNA(Pro) deacylase